MTSRQAGRRIASIAAQRRRMKRGGKRAMPKTAPRKEEPLSPKERRRMVQVLCCGGVFVMMVAVKLLFPGKMDAVSVKAQVLLQRNMDVEAVFSAVGRGFAGEGFGTSELYQAVFGSQDGGEEKRVSPVDVSDAEEGAALEVLHLYPAEETAGEGEAVPAAVLYTGENLPEGVSMEQAMLGFDYCTPVAGTLSSPFGYREHPVEGEDRFHYGIDLAADTGTAIACFADGTVSAVGESSSYGKYCIVHHENGYSTLYAHCSRITASSGAEVKKGDTIAEVGETGMATGAHLHFELQQGGTYLNPIYYVAVL